MTLGKRRICKRSFSEGPVLMVYKKPGSLNQTEYHFSEHLLSNVWAKENTVRNTATPKATTAIVCVMSKQGRWRSRIGVCCCCCFLLFNFFIFFCGATRVLNGHGLQNEWDCGAWYEIPKDSIRIMIMKNRDKREPN